MEVLQSGKLGLQIPSKMAEQRRAIVKAWEKQGLLEGLKGIQKENIAILLENQAGYILNEATMDTAGSRFDTIAFPVVRRVFQRAFVNEIVSVQPIALPTGKLFYLDVRVSYGEDDSSPNMDKTLQNNISREEQMRKTSAQKVAPYSQALGSQGPKFADSSAYERFYDNYGWDLSLGKIIMNDDDIYHYGDDGVLNNVASILAQNNGVIPVTFSLSNNFVPNSPTETTLEFVITQVNGDANLTGTNVYIVYDPAGSTNNDPELTTEIIQLGVPIPYYSQIQRWGRSLIEKTNNGYEAHVVLDFLRNIDGQPPFSPDNFKVKYWSNNNWELEELGEILVKPRFVLFENLEGKTYMGEVTIRFSSVTVEAQIRKLRTHWTPEVAQDIEAYLSIDLEAEYAALLSEQIAAEIDREVITDLLRGAAFRAVWDYNGLQQGFFYGTQKDWNQTLITRINEINAQIKKATLLGGANFIVCSAEASAIFDDLDYFHVIDNDKFNDNDKFSLGIERIGQLGNRYVVYSDAYMPAPFVLVGRKGNTFFETGYIYAPFIPLMLTDVITDPNDFTKRRGIMTRYAKVMVNNRFYGVIYIKNIRKYV